MRILFKKLYEEVEIPKYATEGSAGFDIIAHNFIKYYDPTHPFSYKEQIVEQSMESRISKDMKTLTLIPHGRVLIGAGFSLQIPRGFMLDIRSRSGLAINSGIMVLNSPGTIDPDYRGEIGVILYNSSNNMVAISLGQKIAQGVLVEYQNIFFEPVEQLTDTNRGSGGFGSTDKTT